MSSLRRPTRSMKSRKTVFQNWARARRPDAGDHEGGAGGEAERAVDVRAVDLDDVCAGALGEGLDAAGEEHAVAPGGRGEEQLAPGGDDGAGFGGDALADLGELGLDEVGVGAGVVEMKAVQDCFAGVLVAFFNQPSRRLWEKPDSKAEDDGGDGLHG